MAASKYRRDLARSIAVSFGLLLACGGARPPPDPNDAGSGGSDGIAGAAGSAGVAGSGAIGGTGGTGAIGGAGGASASGGTAGAGARGGSGGAGAIGGSGGAGPTAGSGGSGGGTGGTGAAGGSGGTGAIGGSGGSGGSGDAGATGGAGANGGAAGAGGTGGTGGVPTCVPGQSVGCACTNGLMGAQVCRSDGTFGECICQPGDGGTWEQQQLARLRRGIVGRWTGVQTNSWEPSCACTLTFDGTSYTGHSPNESCTVFYWGTNADSPHKKYVLDDVKAGGEGTGQLMLVFDVDSPGNQTIIQNLVLSADTNQLKLEILYNNVSPLVFTLKREP